MSGITLSVVLAKRPVEKIIPGQTFKQKLLPSLNGDDLKSGEILVRTLYLSLEPAMRAWIKGDTYVPAVKIGEHLRGVVLARVIASKNRGGPPPEGYFEKAPELAPGSEITDLLGVYHWTGLTAYFGLDKIGKPKPGETVVVSGAAGATRSIGGQLAKIAGDLGFDVALNYKDANFKSQFEEATPDLIDVYFDNVGGEILEMVLSRARLFSRFVMSGSITQYNSAIPTGPKNLGWVTPKRIRMQGFIVLDYADEFDDARRQLTQWISNGKIHTRATIVDGGLKVAEQALQGIFSGAKTGKLLVRF
ncbi:ADH-N-2 domain-containing protein [Fusarium sp. LHS14.1]|nr:ADH-N-2 domain-containing protein [Fusarium sp. LHS14.1]